MARIKGDEGGYIYMARHIDTWKIGCTRQDTSYVHSLPSKGDLAGVHARLRDLRKSTGAPWELMHVMYAPKNVMAIKHELHIMLDNFRCSGLELFALPDEMFSYIRGMTSFRENEVTHLEVA